MNSGCARLPAPDRQDDPLSLALLGVDNGNRASVVRPGDTRTPADDPVLSRPDWSGRKILELLPPRRRVAGQFTPG